MKKYSVYVIESENGRYYIGVTKDIERRLKEHNEGISNWTKRFKNWKLIYKEEFSTLGKASERENLLKRQKTGDGFFKIINKTNSR